MSVRDGIEEFFRASENPILFAGAGVGARAGLPIWAEYLDNIADEVIAHDPICGQLMKKYVKEGHLTKAVSVMMISPDIREGEKYTFIAAPLKTYDSNLLVPLVKLPFQAIVTTNFEKSLHDAFAKVHGKSALEFNLDDEGGLAAAAYEDDAFIARIHGRVELPKTMLLAEEHFAKLINVDAYVSFLEHIFTRRQVLFVGFSFLDPAIRHVFRVIDRKFGGMTNGRHVALLPANATDDFIAGLARLNVKRVTYDPSAGHSALWEGIEMVKLSAAAATTKGVSVDPLSRAHKYLAACFVRTHLKGGTVSLRTTVVEGMVSKLIQDSGDAGATVADLLKKLSTELKTPEAGLEPYIKTAVSALAKEGICRVDEIEAIRWSGGEHQGDDLKAAIDSLVAQAAHRFVVREGGTDTPEVRSVLAEFFIELTIKRGWDLGAAFAAGRQVEELDIAPLFADVARSLPERISKSLSAACQNLLMSPDSRSAHALATLGRTSFALDLVLQTPRDALFHSIVLPEKIYLDTNVLLPAFTRGHPFHDVYKTSIDRLIAAAKQANSNVEVLVFDGFLNEIVSHRRLAIDELERWGGEDEAAAMALYYGAGNVNIFVGAFARLRLNQPDLTFTDFLRQGAPYETEKQLGDWLTMRGVRIARDAGATGEGSIYGGIYHHMEVLFADQLERQDRTAKTLAHDAVQLSLLDRDLSDDIRAIFVSADRRLRESLRGSRFAYLGNAMISSVGLAQMIDLMIGNPSEAGSMTRLMWGARITSATGAVRSYLIDRALDEYDEAIAMQIGQLVDGIAEDAARQAEQQGIDLLGDRASEKTMRFLGTFEDRFYEGMRETIEMRRRQEREGD